MIDENKPITGEEKPKTDTPMASAPPTPAVPPTTGATPGVPTSPAPTGKSHPPTPTGPVENKAETAPPTTPQETITVTKAEWEDVQARLRMLYDVADKGRILNYESRTAEKKPLNIKLSRYKGGVIVGWRTITDHAVFHPTTGKQVGEKQEYELLVDVEGVVDKHIVHSYPNFTDARYSDRIECQVTGKSEDYEGKLTYSVKLPSNRIIQLASQFIN